MAGHFMHDFGEDVPDWPLGYCEPATGFDENLLNRIAAALRYSLAKTAPNDIDIWTSIVSRHQPFTDLIASGDLHGANGMLARVFATDLAYGFDLYGAQHDAVAAGDKALAHLLQLGAFDKFLSLLSYLGGIPTQSSEQGDFRQFLRESPDTLIDRLEHSLKMSVTPPSFQGGNFGLVTKRGIFTERSVSGLYVALRIMEIAGSSPKNFRVCEIGGGTGYVAYYSWLLGIRNYTIVDLPTVNAVQAYFLSKNLGPAYTSLAAEEVKGDCIKIISGEQFFESDDNRYDLAVNVDSFPEMNGKILRRYLNSDKFDKLLSINQEMMAPRSNSELQERVSAVVAEDRVLTRLTRNRSWMRPGYVEELYCRR